VPIGVVGEMYIGGAGVARGYLNRPELTAERFVADPFGADPQGRLYKSGDLARWRADGAIEFIGRNDHQVKLRGFRVELGEIEAQLLRQERIKDAIAIVREDEPGAKRLIAYVVSEQAGAELSIDGMRAQLKAVLPEYMIPSAFVVLERLPLTPSGKVDRRALPAPEMDAYASRQYEAPRGEVEEILAGIWQGLLRVERIGRQDNFFELGGHSLQGMKLVAAVEMHLGVQLPVALVFKHTTIREMAEVIDSLRWTQTADFETTELEPIEFEEGVLSAGQRATAATDLHAQG
jgi:acyl carrier protein